MKILVCGGAGYIGSHAVYELIENGYEVVVADNLEKGHRRAVHKDALLCVGDLRNQSFCDSLLREHKIDAVLDFAAYSLVSESMADPIKYFENNVSGTINVLKAMKMNDIKYIVFSSTATVYGVPKDIPIRETAETNPINPYGESKLIVEKMLKWADSAYGIKYASLRYFNVAGAHSSGKIGEDHSPESHLVPNVLKAALNGGGLKIFGNDYNTKDGTCVRDYIHVTDLVKAHILALETVMKKGESDIFNLGNGEGFSNLEIVECAKKVTGIDIPYEVAPRRPGDPDLLVASSEKIVKAGYAPQNNSLEKILESAWTWHKNNPCGFEV